MKNYREILRKSYLGTFVLYSIVMIFVKIVFDLFLEPEINYLEILVSSSIFGLIMSLVMVSIYRKKLTKKA